VLEAGADTLSKVLISGGGRCNVMHDPMKGAKEIAKVCSSTENVYIMLGSCASLVIY
jgi:predicted flavoprotein YhiN